MWEIECLCTCQLLKHVKLINLLVLRVIWDMDEALRMLDDSYESEAEVTEVKLINTRIIVNKQCRKAKSHSEPIVLFETSHQIILLKMPVHLVATTHHVLASQRARRGVVRADWQESECRCGSARNPCKNKEKYSNEGGLVVSYEIIDGSCN